MTAVTQTNHPPLTTSKDDTDQNLRLSVAGMACAGCVSAVENALTGVAGVQSAQVNLAERTALVKGQPDESQLLTAIREAGFDAAVMRGQTAEVEKEVHEQQQYQHLWRQVWVAAIPAIILMIADMVLGILPPIEGSGRWLWLGISAMSLAVMVYAGGHFFKGAWQQLKHGSSNMDTLIALGTGAAWLYSTLVVLFPDIVPSLARYAYFEAALMIIALVNMGQALETRARGRTSAAIKSLMQLQPPIAHVIRNGQEMDLPLEEVGLQETLRVRAGETIPLDGVVLEGQSEVDEAMLTGEAEAVSKQAGDSVTGGTQNTTGSLLIEVSRIGADTVLAQIINQVREAQSSKPAIGRLTDKIAAVFVPVVVAIAVLTFIVWSLFGPAPALSYALVTAMTVLVIACPCALGLATPIAIIAGVGKAAQYGILVRNGEALQQAAKIDTVVMDKTGTLTEGKPVLQSTHTAKDYSHTEALQLAASLEQGSEHPLAQALRDAATQQQLPDLAVNDFEALSGRGIRAQQADTVYYLGNTRLMQQQQHDLDAWQTPLAELDEQGQTPLFLANEQRILALFGVADALKSDTTSSIQALHAQGLKVVMLTGDRQQVAERIAAQVGIDEVYAEMLPDGKLDLIKRLQQKGHSVAMVGDGINDAPALAQADVGFAIGAGTDVALAAADVTLVGGSLQGISRAIKLSKAATRTIWQNLFGAFVYNSLGIPVAAGVLYPWLGLLLNPMVAGAAMALSSVTVVMNANRLTRLKLD